ncbi:hypothetical protein HanRHA438_Chr13g0600051 [Helianthus annuus]|nr:hypothetical protein HanRHA438_Chr13g0600051 [Helianthus annuus]
MPTVLRRRVVIRRGSVNVATRRHHHGGGWPGSLEGVEGIIFRCVCVFISTDYRDGGKEFEVLMSFLRSVDDDDVCILFCERVFS